MKKLLVVMFLIAGAATVHAQDSTRQKMQHKKMQTDSTMRSKSDTMHNKMKTGKMKKDSTK